MKKAILATVLFAGLNASAAYVTVTVCNGGEAGTDCKTISYKVRAAIPMAPKADQHLGSEDQVQPATRYGIPGWLKALNDAFPANPGTSEPGNGAGGPN